MEHGTGGSPGKGWTVIAGLLALLTAVALMTRADGRASTAGDPAATEHEATRRTETAGSASGPTVDPIGKGEATAVGVGIDGGFEPTPPSVAPANLKAREEVGGLVVSWEEVDQASGYQVQWKRQYQDFASERQMDVEGAASTRVELKLAGGQHHEIRVRALNMEATGPWSTGCSGTPREGLRVQCQVHL